MNKIVNKILLAVDKSLLKRHLRQPRFIYSACGPFTKKKERIQKFKGTGHSQYIYQNELNIACFQHDMAYGDFKGLTRRTILDRFRRKILNVMDINVDLLQWSINFLIKKFLVVVLKVRICQTSN